MMRTPKIIIISDIMSDENLETLGKDELVELLLNEDARNAELSSKAHAAEERPIRIVYTIFPS